MRPKKRASAAQSDPGQSSKLERTIKLQSETQFAKAS
jgi:hypothetical protein